MNEEKNKTCPACYKELPEGTDICPFCGFDQLDRIFLDKEEYEAWVGSHLRLCRDWLRPWVCTGAKHGLILSDKDVLYGIGSNEDGQITKYRKTAFRAFGETYYRRPRRMASNVISAAAGSSHSVYVTKDGAVHIRGPAYGSDTIKTLSGAAHVESVRLRDIFYILDQKGQWYVFGDNTDGIVEPVAKEKIYSFPEMTLQSCDYQIEGKEMVAMKKRRQEYSRDFSCLKKMYTEQEDLYRQLCETEMYPRFAYQYGEINLEVEENRQEDEKEEKRPLAYSMFYDQEYGYERPDGGWWDDLKEERQQAGARVTTSPRVTEIIRRRSCRPVLYRTNAWIYDPIPAKKPEQPSKVSQTELEDVKAMDENRTHLLLALKNGDFLWIRRSYLTEMKQDLRGFTEKLKLLGKEEGVVFRLPEEKVWKRI